MKSIYSINLVVMLQIALVNFIHLRGQNQITPSQYTNYAVTSSQVESWFDGIYASASLYDQNNQSALYKLIPAHVLEDSVNEEYVLFTHMIGLLL